MAAQDRIVLGKPIDCLLGETCFVQNYVDHDPGPQFKDLFCGARGFDHHTGTDFRILDLAAMKAGVAVLAAAPGKVRRTRDGVDDVSFREIGDEAIKGKSCGNAAVIDHGRGWRTVYCHMRRQSVAVRPGQTVAAGERIGLVGMSGRTEFPHLHFEVRRGREVVDPYLGAAAGAPCGRPRAPLWRHPVAEGLVYTPAAVLSAGFSGVPPTAELLKAGTIRAATPGPAAPSLLFWIRVIGLVPGDAQALRIVGPDGRVLAGSDPRAVDRAKALSWAYVGKRRRGGRWAPGVYRGEYRLVRDGRMLLERFVELRLP